MNRKDWVKKLGDITFGVPNASRSTLVIICCHIIKKYKMEKEIDEQYKSIIKIISRRNI